jgi:hypothetical protein
MAETMSESQQRAFRGIWIPAACWLQDEVSRTDAELIAEIDNLDREDRGCFASNAYFALLFGLSEKYVSERINALVKEHGILGARYEEAREVLGGRVRYLRVVRWPTISDERREALLKRGVDLSACPRNNQSGKNRSGSPASNRNGSPVKTGA